MNYTNFMLFGLGLLGVLIHNFIKMDGLNREAKGSINLIKYLAIERFTILISICVLVVALIAKTEITQLENVGKWLGLSFVAIGYMAQSIVVMFMGRAQKYLDNQNKENSKFENPAAPNDKEINP